MAHRRIIMFKSYEWKGNNWEFKKADRMALSFMDEVEYLATCIEDEAGDEISLLMGSGFGSRAIALIFKRMDIDFDAITLRCDETEPDYNRTEDFCVYHNIKQFRLEINPDKVNKDKKYRGLSFRQKAMCWAMDNVDGFIVMGNGFNDVRILPHGEIVFERPLDSDWDYNWLEERGRDGCLKFWQATPELVLSTLSTDIFRKWVEISKFIQRPYSSWLKPSLLYDLMPQISSPSERKVNKLWQIPRLNADRDEAKKIMKPLSKALQELVPYMEDYDYYKNMLEIQQEDVSEKLKKLSPV